MPVEFIGMIGTKDESEIRLSAGPVIDPDYVRRFVRAHEDAGFDRVLIGYAPRSRTAPRSRPTRPRTPSGSASWSRTGPGFVAPTLAARQFATLDQFTDGRIAVHIITGGHDAEQRRDGDYLSKDERYARTDEYLDIVKLAWTSDRPFSYHGHVLPGRGPLVRRQVGPAAEDQAVLRRLVRGGLPGRRQARRHLRPVGRAAGGDQGADRLGQRGGQRRRAAPTCPASPSASGRSSARPRSWPGSAPTASSRTTKENIAASAPSGARVLRPRRRQPGERRLAAAAGRRRQGRAARPGAVDRAGRRDRRRRQLDRAGRHAGDGGAGDPRLHRHRRHHDPHPRLRPLRRRDRLRPLPAAAGPRGGRQARRASSGRRRPPRRRWRHDQPQRSSSSAPSATAWAAPARTTCGWTRTSRSTPA